MFGPGCVGVVACDPACWRARRRAPRRARQRVEKLFQVVFDARTLGLGDSGRFVARLIGSNAVVKPHRPVDAAQSPSLEPFSRPRRRCSTALAPLAAATPRARQALPQRLSPGARCRKSPRPAVALMLAIRLSGDRAAMAAMRAALGAAAPTDLPIPPGRSALSQADAGRARRERRLDRARRRARGLGRRAALQPARLSGWRLTRCMFARSKSGSLSTVVQPPPSATIRVTTSVSRCARVVSADSSSVSAVASAVTTVVKFCVPALIFVERDLHRLFGGLDRLRPARELARQDRHRGQLVLDLLEGGQHRLAIGGDARLVGLCAAASTCASVRPPLNSVCASDRP